MLNFNNWISKINESFKTFKPISSYDKIYQFELDGIDDKEIASTMNSYAGQGDSERFVVYKNKLFFTWGYDDDGGLHESMIRVLRDHNLIPKDIAISIDGIKIGHYYYLDPRILCGIFKVVKNNLVCENLSFYATYDAAYEDKETEILCKKYFSFENPNNLTGMALFDKRWKQVKAVIKITENNLIF